MWSIFRVACSLPVLVLVAVSAVILWRWWRIRSAARIPIAEAASRGGYCEVEGTVEARDTFGHPLVEGPVVWMQISGGLVLAPTARRGRVGERDEESERHLHTELGQAIWLRDDTGLARVDPRAASLEVSEPLAMGYDRSRDGEPPPWVADLAARTGEPVDTGRIRRATCAASIVRPGEPLYVLGWASPEGDRGALYRDPQVVPVFRHKPRRPLLVANRKKAERVSNELGLALLILGVAGLLMAAWWAIFGGPW